MVAIVFVVLSFVKELLEIFELCEHRCQRCVKRWLEDDDDVHVAKKRSPSTRRRPPANRPRSARMGDAESDQSSEWQEVGEPSQSSGDAGQSPPPPPPRANPVSRPPRVWATQYGKRFHQRSCTHIEHAKLRYCVHPCRACVRGDQIPERIHFELVNLVYHAQQLCARNPSREATRCLTCRVGWI